MLLPVKRNSSEGQVYIGLLISLAILAILTSTLFTLLISSYDLINLTRTKITARHLAQEKIEEIRNLPYVDIGTVGGIPAGIIPPSQQAFRNGLVYTVNTSVVYVDDEYDNVSPDDPYPNDYKRVRVEITWEGLAASGRQPIVLVTDIASKTSENPEQGGTLKILVFDSQGDPVPQAIVTIIADNTTPPVNSTLQTDNNGQIILPNSPICISCYQISASRDGYSTDRTYSTTEVENPIKPHQSVLDGQITEVGFAIDRLSTLNMTTVGNRLNNFPEMPNQTIILKGEKVIGTDLDSLPVFKFENQFTTDSEGNIEIPNLEWDVYNIIMPDTSSKDISGTKPYLPISLLPNENKTVVVSLDNHTAYSLLVTFIDPSETPISTVSAKLSDGLGYEETLESGIEDDPDFGQLFFSGLSELTYTLEATVEGYIDYSRFFEISGSNQETIILTPE